MVHQLERIDDPARVEAIHAAVASAPVLIADGHHRYGVARAYRDERRAEAGADHPGAYDLTLAFVQELADDQLVVQAIHRLLSGLPDELDLVDVLAASFDIADAGAVSAATIDQMRDRGALCLVAPDGTGRFLVPQGRCVRGGRRPRLRPPRPRPRRRPTHAGLPARRRRGAVGRHGG